MAVAWDAAPYNLSEAYHIIALMTEAANASETSVNIYQTTHRNNPEDSHLHTRHCENLKPRYVVLLEKWNFVN
jgi:hypothetical protein